MAKYIVNLKIADIVIQMRSSFPIQQFSEQEKKAHVEERFNNFLYKGRQKPDISIDIIIKDNLPRVGKAETLFVTIHFQDQSENWRLLKKGNAYVYKSPLEDKKQIMFVNSSFNKVKAYLLPKKDKGRVWHITDVIYDFLQVLMINYFAQRKSGIFVHSIGVKDLNGSGLLFAGKSGAGKSTTARLWHKHSKAMVLNDDRIIVRKQDNQFFIHGSPWHGEFSDYLSSRIESAPFKKLFFIYHSPKNTSRRIIKKEAFSLLYPSLFPTFWDKKCLENIASFCHDLIRKVPCYNMGFVNDKRIIDFVRKI